MALSLGCELGKARMLLSGVDSRVELDYLFRIILSICGNKTG